MLTACFAYYEASNVVDILHILLSPFAIQCYNFTMYKRKIITRSKASELRPKILKPFSVKKFIEISTKLEKSIKEEEVKYGSSSNLFA